MKPIPGGYALRHTDSRLRDAKGDLIPPVRRSHFRWVAVWMKSRCGKPIVPSYRYEVIREGGWWVVVAMQNILIRHG